VRWLNKVTVINWASVPIMTVSLAEAKSFQAAVIIHRLVWSVHDSSSLLVLGSTDLLHDSRLVLVLCKTSQCSKIYNTSLLISRPYSSTT